MGFSVGRRVRCAYPPYTPVAPLRLFYGFFCGTAGALRLPALHTCRTFIGRGVSAAHPPRTVLRPLNHNHHALLTQMLRVETQMLFNKRGDKIITVVVTWLHAQR